MTISATWVSDQLAELGLKPDDEHYEHARQAAERGWSADRIAKLIGFNADEREIKQ